MPQKSIPTSLSKYLYRKPKLPKNKFLQINFHCNCCFLFHAYLPDWMAVFFLLFFFWFVGREASNINSDGFSVFFVQCKYENKFLLWLKFTTKSECVSECAFFVELEGGTRRLWGMQEKQGNDRLDFIALGFGRNSNFSWEAHRELLFVFIEVFLLTRYAEQTMKNWPKYS